MAPRFRLDAVTGGEQILSRQRGFQQTGSVAVIGLGRPHRRAAIQLRSCLKPGLRQGTKRVHGFPDLGGGIPEIRPETDGRYNRLRLH